ncbi:DNA cytosine methyltransferase [Sporomusa paucivorans]|uniref:DNA cytosine methyltransferase n=1 Tax=Sporomusa paucivorans TaxID=2376 RepID=UPI0035712494
MRERPVAIDFFAGAGGLSEGLHMAGWDVAVAVEKDPFAARSYELNQSMTRRRRTAVLVADIENIGRQELSQALMQSRGKALTEVDLIAGGPPCQGFSHIGSRALDDPRNRLFFHFVRMISIVRPKAFIAENVKGILSFAGRRIPAILEMIFDRLGYVIAYDVLNSIDFGVPQDRPRVIFFGIRKDLAGGMAETGIQVPAACMPEGLRREFAPGRIITVGEALSDLPPGRGIALEQRIWAVQEENGQNQNDDYCVQYQTAPQNSYQRVMRKRSCMVFDHHTKGMSEGRLNKVQMIPEGSTAASAGRQNAWRRLNRSSYSHTLQAHMGKDLKEFIHPCIHRWITVREAARLQSFRDDYRFSGAQSVQLRQIGNAVPPHLGWAIGRAIGEQLGVFEDEQIPLRGVKVKQKGLNLVNVAKELLHVLEYKQEAHADDEVIADVLEKIFNCMLAEASANEDTGMQQRKLEF